MISENYYRYDSTVLAYVSLGEEGNINLVELVGEPSILCDWKDPSYTRKDKTLTNVRKHRDDNVA
jgi:hypothetical protein